ncbi:9933_t:CDS:2, partial [Diversispora eburnea]
EIEHKPYNLSNNELKEIGEKMVSMRKDMPLDIGKPPRDISKHHAGFKAVEWRNWIIHYSIPLLIKYLPERYIKGWAFFVKAVKLCLNWTITNENLIEIEENLKKFYHHYESSYYEFEVEQISTCRICYHYLLHVTECIKFLGPCWCYWQFPMERICGMLLPLVKSKIKPYENLANNISLMNCMSHIPYVPDLKHILIEEDNEKKWSSNQ